MSYTLDDLTRELAAIVAAETASRRKFAANIRAAIDRADAAGVPHDQSTSIFLASIAQLHADSADAMRAAFAAASRSIGHG